MSLSSSGSVIHYRAYWDRTPSDSRWYDDEIMLLEGGARR